MFTLLLFIADCTDSQMISEMQNDNYRYADMTEKIIGCARKVHGYFGLAFPVAIYQRAFVIELEKSGLEMPGESGKGCVL